LDLGFVVVRAREVGGGRNWLDAAGIATNPRRYQAISRALIPEEGGDRRKGIFVGGVC
jgi:hypothetical protein